MDISTILSTVTTAKDFAALIIGKKIDSAVTDKAVELQGSIISLQMGILEMQAQLQSVTQEKRSLEEELAKIKNWESEAEKHEIHTVAKGVHVVKHKISNASDEHKLWYCQSCWHKQVKSALQYSGQDYGGTHYYCPCCNAKIYDHSDCSSPVY